MRLLKTSEQLAWLLSGFESNGHRIEWYKDINDDYVFPESIKELVHLQGYIPQMEFIESEIDQDKTQLAKAKAKVNFRITQLAYSGASFKDHKAIDYKKEILKLHPDYEIRMDGLLTKATWYENFDNTTKSYSDDAIIVELVWELDMNEPIPVARDVIKRTVTRKWKATNTEDIHITDVDGNIIQSVTFTNGYPDDSSFHKITEKYYPTRNEKMKEGKRRRENVIAQLSEGLGMRLYGAGYTPAQIDEMLTNFLREHTQDFSTYIEGGKGALTTLEVGQNAIQNDAVTTWLTQELKDYAVAKLRGEV